MFKIKTDTSARNQLDMTDLSKVLRDASMVGLGAGIVYLMNHTADLNLGTGTAIGVSVILNLLYKWIKDNSPATPNPTWYNSNQPRFPQQQQPQFPFQNQLPQQPQNFNNGPPYLPQMDIRR